MKIFISLFLSLFFVSCNYFPWSSSDVREEIKAEHDELKEALEEKNKDISAKLKKLKVINEELLSCIESNKSEEKEYKEQCYSEALEKLKNLDEPDIEKV